MFLTHQSRINPQILSYFCTLNFGISLWLCSSVIDNHLGIDFHLDSKETVANLGSGYFRASSDSYTNSHTKDSGVGDSEHENLALVYTHLCGLEQQKVQTKPPVVLPHQNSNFNSHLILWTNNRKNSCR